jgi:hypothetical protein
MTKGREVTEGLEGEARGNAIESWLEEATESLEKETDSRRLARHLDEMAWIRWRSEAESGARALLVVSEALSTTDDVMRRMTRARVEGLFSPFLSELRVVEQSALDDVDADEKS